MTDRYITYINRMYIDLNIVCYTNVKPHIWVWKSSQPIIVGTYRYKGLFNNSQTYAMFLFLGCVTMLVWRIWPYIYVFPGLPFHYPWRTTAGRWPVPVASGGAHAEPPSSYQECTYSPHTSHDGEPLPRNGSRHALNARSHTLPACYW